MARKPTSLKQIESAEIADTMGAVQAAALIRADSRLEVIVMHAMAELSPADFHELLKRTRDRRAAYEALAFIGCKPKTPHNAIELPFALWEMCTDWCRGWTHKGLKEGLKECFQDAHDSLQLWTVTRRHQKYTKYDFQKLVTFIGHGNDASAMEFTLRQYGDRMTDKIGQWMRRELALRRRTPEQLDALRRSRRSSKCGNVYLFKRA